MSVLGTFEKVSSGFKGSLKTLQLKLPDVQLLKIEGTKRGETSPDFRVYVEGVELGAGWNKHYEDKTGKKTFVSAVLDDPSMPHPLNFSLFVNQDGKSYQAVWNRQPTRQ